MELYILDSLYRRIQVVDRYESVVWSERFAAKGDFELVVFSTLENRTLFKEGVRLATNVSYRVMTVETIEDSTDDEGRRLLKVKGPSLEGILEHRLAYSGTDLTSDPKWILTGTPLEIANQLFHDICVLGNFDPGDIISGVIEDNVIFPDDTIDPSEDEIAYLLDPKSLYQAEVDLCAAYDMGFRLVRHHSTNVLYFDVYTGSDRTTQQTALAAVVFSPDLDNLRNTNKLTTMALYKNVAYVLTPVGIEIVYPLDVDPDIEGFERRVLIVRADDITDPDGPTASALMVQRGLEELAKNKRFTALDGEVPPVSQYVYGVHYNLGDLVELRDDDGSTANMRVTEQIFVGDREGFRSFPTLSINTFVTPGSWLSMGPEVDWDDMTTEEWEDMP
jgi:ReqiPepy6 Gp37-like protein